MSETPKANIYQQGPDTGAMKAEAERLRVMDELVRGATTEALAPALERYRGGVLLDIGSGAGTIVSRLCAEAGLGYRPLDINKHLLEKERHEPPSHKIFASNTAIPCVDRSFEVTHSRAITAWAQEPQDAIAEQLRVTDGMAVLSEFNWDGVEIGADLQPHEEDLVWRTRDSFTGALTALGFKPNYGKNQLGEDINSVMDKKNIQGTTEKKIQPLPDGDYRPFLFTQAEALLKFLQHPDLHPVRDSLHNNIEEMKQTPRASFTPPPIVTHRVTMTRND